MKSTSSRAATLCIIAEKNTPTRLCQRYTEDWQTSKNHLCAKKWFPELTQLKRAASKAAMLC